MDRLIVERKLEALRSCVARLHAKRPATLEALRADEDLQDVLVLNLSRAVQLCVDLAAHWLSTLAVPVPQTMGDTFVRLVESGRLDADLGTHLRKAVGFRNLAVHNYEAIDWAIVFAIVTTRLDDFAAFAREVARQALGTPPAA